MVNTSAGLAAQYRAASESSIIANRSAFGRIEARGADVLDLLNRLGTNRTDTLAPGQGEATMLTTNKGRILDLLTVLRLPKRVLLLTSAGAAGTVAAWLEKYTITEDAAFADVSAETTQLTLSGPRAPELLGRAFDRRLAGLAAWTCALTDWQGAQLLIARTDPLGVPGYDVVGPASAAASLRAHLVETGRGLGALEVGPEVWEMLRVQAGVPLYGRELTQDYNPLEANLERAVSWTKGCYVGQEVVARLHTYHKVQRHLVRLALSAETPPPPGSRLRIEDVDVGVLTSAARAPDAVGVAALGYLRTPFVRQGLELEAVSPDGTVAPGYVAWAPELPAEALTPARLLTLAEEAQE
ncbi:MAG: aminomethyl transferase family protein [Dehalococcoidia bacterium]|nr:aminomethyl transferase family protein [Dehalococcoidia bacterium]